MKDFRDKRVEAPKELELELILVYLVDHPSKYLKMSSNAYFGHQSWKSGLADEPFFYFFLLKNVSTIQPGFFIQILAGLL